MNILEQIQLVAQKRRELREKEEQLAIMHEWTIRALEHEAVQVDAVIARIKNMKVEVERMLTI